MKEFPKHIGWDNWGSMMCDAELFSPLVSEALTAHGLPLFPIEAGFPGTLPPPVAQRRRLAHERSISAKSSRLR